MKGIRTFIGIFPPPHIQSAIAEIQSPLKTGRARNSMGRSKKVSYHNEVLRRRIAGTTSSTSTFSDSRRSINPPIRNYVDKRSAVFLTTHAPKIVWIGSSGDENAPACRLLHSCRKCVHFCRLQKGRAPISSAYNARQGKRKNFRELD